MEDKNIAAEILKDRMRILNYEGIKDTCYVMDYWYKPGDGTYIFLEDIGNHNVLKLHKDVDNGNISFANGSDGHSVKMPKQEAIKALEEAIAWIRGSDERNI